MKTERRHLLVHGLGLLLSLLTLACSADPVSELPKAENLQAEAESAAASGQPLIVLFSRKDCRFCEQVRHDYLLRLLDEPAGSAPLVRQIDQDSQAPLIGFDGAQSTHARVASQQKIKLVPVVAFFGPNGEVLAKRIVGLRLPDFYQSYLDDAIAKAKARLSKDTPG